MGSKWKEAGILRKKQIKENHDDLLVFGYACKLFRDDEKALFIDQGKHLIPWMGDDRLKIDRYDGRGALSDLASCEASKEGYDTNRWLDLSESERKIEQLCDEYRYYYLYNNEDEENLYKEEEAKRKHKNEFHYSYDVPKEENTVPTCEEEDKPFKAPPELDVPVDIEIPKTVKENARIAKTAQFVSEQGPQMEILIKAKQTGNPQFSFMNQNDPLYKYYRHLVQAIKCGRYKVHKEEKQNANDQSETAKDEHYLHPILATQVVNATSAVATTSTAASVNAAAAAATASPVAAFKPKADCAYSLLVSRIKGSSSVQEEATVAKNTEQQDDCYKYYQSQYYEYYKQIVQQYANQSGCSAQQIIQNTQLQEQIQAQAAHFAQIACVQYQQQQQQQQQQQKQQKPQPKNPEEVKKETKVQSLVHYSSDSSDNEEEPVASPPKELGDHEEQPTEEVMLIIEKMATYVSKNGSDFEQSVREKGDKRFDFLNEHHKHHKFYKRKVDEFRNKKKATVAPNQQQPQQATVTKENKEKRVIAPVSFSIKKPKEEAPKEIKSALPVEESDEDEDGPHDDIVSKEQQDNAAASPAAPSSSSSPPPPPPPPPPKPSDPVDLEDDPILEMIDLTDDTDDKRLRKVLAEERIKDKLAQAAKEKIWRKSSDRASIQLERRRKAAMFLKMQETTSKCSSREDKEDKEDASKGKTADGSGDQKEEIFVEDSDDVSEGEKQKKISGSSGSSSSKKKKKHKRKSSKHSSSMASRHTKKSKRKRHRSASRDPSNTSSADDS